MSHAVLDAFHPLIAGWFSSVYGRPTGVQSLSWPAIIRGEHVLITAPTGSGKTLTAFLWAINQLLTGAWPDRGIRVVYVSPLKALNNDIRRNLLKPLGEIERIFRREGLPLPRVKVFTRSGDTPSSERQRMLRRPPEILITTPESLNLILASPKARRRLEGIRTVILDEIHAVAASKRGTHLMTAVERLTLLNGEFQRLGLSATIRPLERIAEFLGGYRLVELGQEAVYERRPVTVIRSPDEKRYQISVRFPQDARHKLQDNSWWPALVGEFKRIIETNRSTLFFTNARRLAEKITLWINQDGERQLAYAHHGSLSRELRSVVERRLKEGSLAAIVATSSLELGIDIGSLDEVVMVQTPFSVSSALQRIGRAGHAVGQVSRGCIFPTHGRDLLSAAVMSRAVIEQDIEEARPPACPLDVMAQVIISMTGVEEWDIDRLFAFLTTSSPYRSLSRRQFNQVLEMLAGRYAETRIRELAPRISLDRQENRIRARPGALPLVYQAGGTIPDRGYYELRLRDSGAKIGELDEEFVWERRVGDTFNLGTQSWKITGIDSQKVEVIPWEGPLSTNPFWKAERAGGDFHFHQRIGRFLETWNDRLDTRGFAEVLTRDYYMEEPAASELIAFLQRQREVSGADLPHRHHLLIEYLEGSRVMVHTLWGSRVNQPLALALAARWQEGSRAPLEVFADNDGIMLILPHPEDISGLIASLKPTDLEDLLRRKLEGSGIFGARFRENAGRALLLPRGGFKRRTPLWFTRQRARKLLAALMGYEDFPILLETWRTCLQDEFDLESLKLLLGELGREEIRLTEVKSPVPSPMAAGMIWVQTNEQVYQQDLPLAERISRLSNEVLREVLFSSRLRPQIAPELIEAFERKVQRTAPGYCPSSPVELLDWVKERLILPPVEWQDLLAAAERDHGLSAPELSEALKNKLLWLKLPGAQSPGVAAVEVLPRLLGDLGLSQEAVEWFSVIGKGRPGPPSEAPCWKGACSKAALPPACSPPATSWLEEQSPPPDEASEAGSNRPALLLGEWLRYYGPLEPGKIRSLFGISSRILEQILAELKEEGTVVIDRISRRKEGAAEPEALEVCDTENLEILLRWTRRASRPSFKALPLNRLTLFLAWHQGLAEPGDSVEDLQGVLEKLFGYPAPAESWEADLLPARLSPYYGSWLDALFRESELQWFGCGRGRISFGFSSDRELYAQPEAEEVELLPEGRGRYSFWDLKERTGMSSSLITRRLWEEVWRGRLSNDSMEVLRRGIANRFKASGESEPRGRRPRRMGYNRWKSSRPFEGLWYRLDPEAVQRDRLEEEELQKDRIRQLLARYGILFKELLGRELPLFRWAALFRTLRIMELSGEILSGYFFEGIPGLQFMTPRSFRWLSAGLPEGAIYWMSAVDPASPCGLGLTQPEGGPLAGLPPRIPSSHLVFHGAQPVVISKKRGREIEFRVGPEHPQIPEYIALFRVHLLRDFHPWTAVRVERINGQPAPSSPYRLPLEACGFRPDFKQLVLYGTP